MNVSGLPEKEKLIMASDYILFIALIFLLTLLLASRHYLVRQEYKLGYPRQGENFEDVKLLILLQKNFFALRCYRRIYPKASFAEAKYMINKLRKELAELAKVTTHKELAKIATQHSGSLKK